MSSHPHRRSRRQFRTPLLVAGQDTPGGLPPRRRARRPEAPLPVGRATRGALLHTGEAPPPPVPGGLFRRRIAASPQPGPWPGAARRGRLAGRGLTSLPVVAPRRGARSPWPAPGQLAGRGRRGRLRHTGSAVLAVTAPVRFRLGASRQTTFTLAASRDTTFRLGASQAMSVSGQLAFFRGEDIVLDFEMTPLADVSGWAITFKIADTLGGSVQVTKTASVTDGPRGRFRVTIASADTASLAVGRWTWDVRRTDGGSKATLAHGELDLRQEVTA